ncbi:MAG: PEP-CTERM sorting domain-containing protein [Myxococcota bacterium]|jgi:hypothetical protein|nr:PEP-CTERM sorting domain-containing protein [Myxococcota bacterium]
MLRDAVRLGAARKLAATKRLVLLALSSAAFFAVLAAPASAHPILPSSDLTLDDLVNGDLSLYSINEELVFTNWAVEVSGGSQNLEDYAIQQLWDGFKIRSEAAPMDEVLEIVLTYDVTTLRDTLALDATGFTVTDSDRGASALLDAFNGDGASILQDGRVGNNAHLEIPFWTFTEIARTAAVVEHIAVDAEEFGGKWVLRHRFKTIPVEPIPEPNTALLLGAGMVGLARYARKRRA